MLYDIKSVIDEIYKNNNKEIFILGCRKSVDFIGELVDMIEKNCLDVNVYTDVTEPVIEIKMIVNKV